MTDTKMAAKQQQGESWGELAKTVIYAGLIAIVIRTFLFQPFNIPSGSMENTLLIGDYLFVEKFAYGYSRYTFPFGGWPFGNAVHGRFMGRDPQRGDVVVFKFPRDNSTDFIKRVIGLPGDTIVLTPDAVIINGYTLHEPYITPAPPGETENPEAQTIKLGESQYFVMGDNRTNSQDSRFFGPIDSRSIIGQAEFVVWPLNALHPVDTFPGVYSKTPEARSIPAAANLALRSTPHVQRAG